MHESLGRGHHGQLASEDALHGGVLVLQLLQLAERQVRNAAGPFRASIHPLIMRDNQLAAAADVHIQFNPVRAHLGGQLKGFQRVFGGIRGSAAMREYLLHADRTSLIRYIIIPRLGWFVYRDPRSKHASRMNDNPASTSPQMAP